MTGAGICTHICLTLRLGFSERAHSWLGVEGLGRENMEKRMCLLYTKHVLEEMINKVIESVSLTEICYWELQFNHLEE